MTESLQASKLADLKKIASLTNHLGGFAFGPGDFARVFVMYYPAMRDLIDSWEKYPSEGYGFIREFVELSEMDNPEPLVAGALTFIKTVATWRLTDDELEAFIPRIPTRTHRSIQTAIELLVNHSRAMISDELGDLQ